MEFLAELARNKTSVRVEIEHSPLKFNSQLTLKKGAVIIAKPGGLREGLAKGSRVRLRIPGHGKREFRLVVTTPNFNLANGNAVFICDAPEGEVESKRESERFDVRRFGNLRLELASEEFRVIDISVSGLKVVTAADQAEEYFPLGKELHSAHIRVGANVQVDLARIVPRAHHGSTVGCEFAVKQQTPSETYLKHLLDSLSKAETQRMTVSI